MVRRPTLVDVANNSTARLTTRGRRTGKAHTVTTWFLVDGEKLYLATMKMRRDWPRNLKKNGYVELDIAGHTFTGTGKQVTDKKRLAHVAQLTRNKYWAAWLASWFGFGAEGAFEVTIQQ
jgi:deazaflavin-dependent oxidoreductase (nitroreductase family)